MMLGERFVAVARRAGATAGDETLAAVAAELLARWSEPHRQYHNVVHLLACLDAAGVEDEPAVALAVWGHDAVYEPRSSSNEEHSALLLTGLLARCGVPVPVVAEAARLVRVTAGHAVGPGDRAGQVLADADLAVLARPWPDYMSYVDKVRAEYAHVPDELWRVGRARVLHGLLDLPRLFHHQPAWEEPARANLRRELAGLTADAGR